MKENTFLALSVFLLLLSLSFDFELSEGKIEASWFWENRIQIPVLLVLLATACLGYYAYLKTRTTRP